MILILLALVFSGEVLTKTHTITASQRSRLTKASNKQVDSKQEYPRNSAKSSSLLDLRKYPSGIPRKKVFLRAVIPCTTSQNAVTAIERNRLISEQYQDQWSPAERVRLKDVAKCYKVKQSGSTREIPWNTLLEHVGTIPTSTVAMMVVTGSGWGTLKLARNNNNLFGMKCMKGCHTNVSGEVKGYSQLNSVKGSVSTYITNLNTHPAYFPFRKPCAQLRKADQGVTVTAVIHKLKGYSTKGKSYNNYLSVMYQDNQRLIVAHM